MHLLEAGHLFKFFSPLESSKKVTKKKRGTTTKSVKSTLGSSTHLLDVGHLFKVLFASWKAEKGHQEKTQNKPPNQ